MEPIDKIVLYPRKIAVEAEKEQTTDGGIIVPVVEESEKEKQKKGYHTVNRFQVKKLSKDVKDNYGLSEGDYVYLTSRGAMPDKVYVGDIYYCIYDISQVVAHISEKDKEELENKDKSEIVKE